jgi:hypothetical protein
MQPSTLEECCAYSHLSANKWQPHPYFQVVLMMVMLQALS